MDKNNIIVEDFKFNINKITGSITNPIKKATGSIVNPIVNFTKNAFDTILNPFKNLFSNIGDSMSMSICSIVLICCLLSISPIIV